MMPALRAPVAGRDGAAGRLVRLRPVPEPPRFVMLRRGGQRMVLFRGKPDPEVIAVLQRLNVVIGLVLTAAGDGALQGLGAYGYIYIGQRSRATAALGDALHDLARASWTVDPRPSVPVIVSRGPAFSPLSEQRFSRGDAS